MIKWISVKTRLPNDEELNRYDKQHPDYRKFLCTIKLESFEPLTRILYFSDEVGWTLELMDYNKEVTAWRPLPEPYVE